MEKVNRKAIFIDNPPKVYIDEELKLPVDVSLPVNSEIELIEACLDGSTIKVGLPDSSLGYISGNEKLHIIQSAWTVKEMKVFKTPDNSEMQLQILPKGEAFEMLNSLDEKSNNWIRIRFAKNQIGYIKGSVKVITEDSLIEGIGGLIKQGYHKERIVKSYSRRGIPETKISDSYQQIMKLKTAYEKSPEGKKVIKSRSIRRILYGVFWAGGGTFAIVISLSSDNIGGSFYIFFLVIAWGLFEIVRGILGLLKYSGK